MLIRFIKRTAGVVVIGGLLLVVGCVASLRNTDMLIRKAYEGGLTPGQRDSLARKLAGKRRNCPDGLEQDLEVAISYLRSPTARALRPVA